MQLWGRIYRLAIGIAAYGYIGYRLVAEFRLGYFDGVITGFHPYFAVILLLVLVLLPVNWGIEGLKWRLAMGGVVRMSFIAAIRGVLLGVLAGLLTPNRMGEPFGRAAAVPAGSRATASLLAVWVSSSQLLSTLFFGAIGWMWLSRKGVLLSSVGVSITMLWWVMAGVVVLALFVYLYLERLPALLKWLPWALKRVKRYGLLKVSLSKGIKMKIFALSLLRHAVFSLQLLMVLLFLGVEVPVPNLLAGICTTYLLATLVPSLTITEPAIRASVGVMVIGNMSNAHAAIMGAFFVLWLINIALPVLAVVWIPKKLDAQRLAASGTS